MYQKNFEQFFAFHCAPTLTGIKAGNLITIPKQKFKNSAFILEEYIPCLRCKGLALFTLVETLRYTSLFMYCHSTLETLLNDKKNMEILYALGYRYGDSVHDHLLYLRARMQLRKTFPHEIGLFLGYPYEDVKGFIENNGKNSKINGYWKVYDNPTTAQDLFAKYTECTHTLCECLGQGTSLKEYLTAI